MPGPYIHISGMRHIAADLASKRYRPAGSDRINPQWNGADTLQLGRILQENPNFASLGAIGPDFFYFLPDFRDVTVAGVRIPISSSLIAILNFLEGLYEAVDPYISKWEHYLGPISEDTAEEMSRLTGGLSESVGNITGELTSILITALEDLVVKQWDLMGFFSLGLNEGFDEQAFFWSDMLHYRETGSFARALWEHADAANSDGARAYVLGYMTHLAADVTGHPFVNTISGGPYRLHWDRHHLVENHIDAYWYLQDKTSPRRGDRYPQLTESALYYDIAFGDSGKVKTRPEYPTGKTMRENWERHRKLDIDSELPDPLPDILIGAMVDVFYKNGKHPKILRDNDGRPSADQIRETYRLLFRYLKYTTVDGFAHEPPDPPDLFPNLNFPTLSDPHDDPPGKDDSSFWDDLLDFLLSIFSILAYIVEVAVYLATLPWAVLADLVTYPVRLGLYYAFELPLFHILKTFRSVLVMTGYLLPMEDEIALGVTRVGIIDSNTFGQILGQIGDIFGGLPWPEKPGPLQTFRDTNYPHVHPDDEFRHPWQYPIGVRPELSTTTVGPYAGGVGPEILFKDINIDPVIRDRLEVAKDPTEADAVGPDLTPDHHLGDAISFSKYLIWLESRSKIQEDGQTVPLVEWNLDSDRGYGYHGWDWNRDRKLTEKDPEGYQYFQPCTWPQQSEPSSRWKPDVPLQLHWTGRGLEDPGCHPISQYTILVSTSPSNLTQPTGGGKYSSGQTATVTAQRYVLGYVFKRWTENGNVVSTSNSYSFTVTKNRNLVAEYEGTIK